MARYHFNITDGHVIAPDTEGAELVGHQAAMAEALRSIRQMLSESDKKGLCRRHWRMDVVDESGLLMFSLPFGHALQADQLRPA